MKQEPPVCPDDWFENLGQTLDFRASLEALDGYEHFHTHVLRGWMQNFLQNPERALEEFEVAQQMYPEFPDTPDNRRRLFLTHSQALEIRFFQEASDSNDETRQRTDEALEQIRLNSSPANPISERILFRAEGAFHLLRGDFELALKNYEDCLAISKSDIDDALYPYAGAAAAANELGHLKQARRHYENLDLAMSFTNSRVTFYLLSSWLCALCDHWGWKGESDRWHETLQVMECAPGSRELLIRRATILKGMCRSGETIPLI